MNALPLAGDAIPRLHRLYGAVVPVSPRRCVGQLPNIRFDRLAGDSHHPLNIGADILHRIVGGGKHQKYIVGVVGQNVKQLLPVADVVLLLQQLLVRPLLHEEYQARSAQNHPQQDDKGLGALQNIVGVAHDDRVGHHRHQTPAVCPLHRGKGQHALLAVQSEAGHALLSPGYAAAQPLHIRAAAHRALHLIQQVDRRSGSVQVGGHQQNIPLPVYHIGHPGAVVEGEHELRLYHRGLPLYLDDAFGAVREGEPLVSAHHPLPCIGVQIGLPDAGLAEGGEHTPLLLLNLAGPLAASGIHQRPVRDDHREIYLTVLKGVNLPGNQRLVPRIQHRQVLYNPVQDLHVLIHINFKGVIALRGHLQNLRHSLVPE